MQTLRGFAHHLPSSFFGPGGASLFESDTTATFDSDQIFECLERFRPFRTDTIETKDCHDWSNPLR
jgi:hypothetical protein